LQPDRTQALHNLPNIPIRDPFKPPQPPDNLDKHQIMGHDDNRSRSSLPCAVGKLLVDIGAPGDNSDIQLRPKPILLQASIQDTQIIEDFAVVFQHQEVRVRYVDHLEHADENFRYHWSDFELCQFSTEEWSHRPRHYHWLRTHVEKELQSLIKDQPLDDD